MDFSITDTQGWSDAVGITAAFAAVGRDNVNDDVEETESTVTQVDAAMLLITVDVKVDATDVPELLVSGFVDVD